MHVDKYILYILHLFYRPLGELLPLQACFLQQWNVWSLNGIFQAFKNLKLWKSNQPQHFELDMKWLKTTARNSLSRNLAENPSLTSMKHKNLSARGHQWPIYHLQIHKISFPMVAESALGYLIPGLTQISSISLIL